MQQKWQLKLPGADTAALQTDPRLFFCHYAHCIVSVVPHRYKQICETQPNDLRVVDLERGSLFCCSGVWHKMEQEEVKPAKCELTDSGVTEKAMS